MAERPPTPLLDRLANARVFSVEWDGSAFVFEEKCDDSFSEEFTVEELTALAGELLALAASASIT